MHLSVILPAFNEAKKIEKDLRDWLTFLGAQRYEAELIVVNDGSRDDTADRVRAIAKSESSVRVYGYTKNRGKGYAIRYGIARAQGLFMAFADVGRCVPPTCLAEGLALLEDGWDFAIGSRRAPGAHVAASPAWYRRVGSVLFRRLMQAWLEVRVSDSQCGFKVYRAAAAQSIFAHVATDGYMFDVEALLVAQALGLRGTEFPVEWRADKDSRYRPVTGTLSNFKDLVAIKLRTQWISGSR